MSKSFLCVVGTSLDENCIADAKLDFDRVKRPDEDTFFLIARSDLYTMITKYDMSPTDVESREIMGMKVVSLLGFPGSAKFIITQDPDLALEELCD